MNRAPSLTLVAMCMATGLAIGLSSCSGSSGKVETEAALLKTVEDLAAKHDHKTALIHLRNAISQYPNSATVRLSMGRVLLESADPTAAAVELEKALALKAPEEEVVPLLARAMLGSGEATRMVARFGSSRLSSAAAQADLFSALATAHWQMGKPVLGDAALIKALEADPQAPRPLLLQAHRQAAKGEVDAALGSLALARQRQTDKAPLSQFEGELLLVGKRDLKGAESAFSAALQARPDFAPAHAGLVGLALQQGDPALARQRAEQMARALPKHPHTLLVQGRLALIDGKFDVAQDKSQQLLRMAPEDLRALMLAGETALRSGAHQQGEAHLNRVLSRAPDALPARKLLAQAQLRNGQPAAALATLQPALDSGKADGTSHALAAQAHLRGGDTGRALSHFKKAKDLSPQDARIRSAYALAQFGRGQPQALSELESLAAHEDAITTDLALISARLQQGNHEAAIRAIGALDKKQPNQALTADLEGRVQLMQGKTAAARNAFERALEREPHHHHALMSLVGLDIREGHPEAATARLEAVVQRDPRNAQALVSLAQHRSRLGAPQTEVDDILQRAVKAAPDSAAVHVAQISHLLAAKQTDAALKAAQEAAAALPQRSELLQWLARAQWAAGEHQQATATLRRLAAQDPKSPQPLLDSAELHALMGEPDQARQSLRKVLDLQPDHLQAQSRLIELELKAGQSDRAIELARQIQRQRPKETTGLQLEGDIAARSQSWNAAIKAYRTAHKTAASSETAIRLHGGLVAADRKPEAKALAAEWEKSNPKDTRFQMHLGQQAASQRQWDVAERHFARVVKHAPDHGLALNNLAYAMAMQDKRDAVKPAKRAMELLPDQTAVMDTMALALAADRQLDQALAMQKRALDREGTHQPILRLTLARLYLQAGDKNLARQELQALASMGQRFPAQQEVKELLKSIS